MTKVRLPPNSTERRRQRPEHVRGRMRAGGAFAGAIKCQSIPSYSQVSATGEKTLFSPPKRTVRWRPASYASAGPPMHLGVLLVDTGRQVSWVNSQVPEVRPT